MILKINYMMKKLLNFLVAFVTVTISVVNTSNAQNNVYAWPDTAICAGATVTLNVSSCLPLCLTL
jgi:hypothetical protein